MPEPTGERDETRRRLRAERAALSEADRAASSVRLATLLEDLDELRGPGRIGTYLPTQGEIDPNRALARLRDRGWQVHLPVLEDPPPSDGAASMLFCPWQTDDPLTTNRYGILEPTPAGGVTARQLDLILVPCVAVDRQGNRLGFGAGYYDRALRTPSGPAPWDERSHTVTIAVAYEFQLLEALATEDWDVPMDLVVTDGAVIRPAS